MRKAPGLSEVSNHAVHLRRESVCTRHCKPIHLRPEKVVAMVNLLLQRRGSLLFRSHWRKLRSWWTWELRVFGLLCDWRVISEQVKTQVTTSQFINKRDKPSQPRAEYPDVVIGWLFPIAMLRSALGSLAAVSNDSRNKCIDIHPGTWHPCRTMAENSVDVHVLAFTARQDPPRLACGGT